MISRFIILNEREFRKARADLARAQERLSIPALVESTRSEISPDAIERHRKSISAIANDLELSIKNYNDAKHGKFKALEKATNGNPGTLLIVARIACGMSQSDLALALGIKEQQIQRYESERYRSISLNNYRRISHYLGVDLTATIREDEAKWLRKKIDLKTKFDQTEVNTVIKHARQQKWFEFLNKNTESEEKIVEYLFEYNQLNANPALLRTGLNSLDLSKEFSLIAWRARISELASKESNFVDGDFDPLDISWLQDLVKLSVYSDGPLRAGRLLRSKGIIFVVEPQITGLRLDGAAMMYENAPIVALTLRHDRVDNFWFTLMHEIAHIFLHHRTGLRAGFFDDLDNGETDDIEEEANDFAGSILIPPEQWRRSPARISKDENVIISFCDKIGINPAIAFGRIRKDRSKYDLFSNRVGAGTVRSLFF